MSRNLQHLILINFSTTIQKYYHQKSLEHGDKTVQLLGVIARRLSQRDVSWPSEIDDQHGAGRVGGVVEGAVRLAVVEHQDLSLLVVLRLWINMVVNTQRLQ